MHLRISSAMLLAAPVIALPANPSYADPAGPPAGRVCSYVSIGEPDTGQYTGQINGGPLAAPGHQISIRCSIHLGNTVHSGPAADEAQAGPSPDVVVLLPRLTLAGPYGDESFAVCTSATVGPTTWYWDGAAWTTDSGASCATIRTCPPDCLPPAVEDVLDRVVGTADELVPGSGDLARCFDPWTQHSTCVEALLGFLCQASAGQSPGVPGVVDLEEDGDLYVAGEWFLDCPPYEEW